MWQEIFISFRTGLEWEEHWEIVDCCGCEEPSFRLMWWSAHEDRRDSPERDLVHHEHAERFPPRLVESRSQPNWIRSLPDDVSRLFEEIYRALDQNCLWLTAIGTRTVLERVMYLKVGDRGRFQETLDQFAQEGHITRSEVKDLDAVIDAGNAAAHRGHAPTSEDITIMLDIVERVLERLHVTPRRATALKWRTPKRQQAKPKGRSQVRRAGAADELVDDDTIKPLMQEH